MAISAKIAKLQEYLGQLRTKLITMDIGVTATSGYKQIANSVDSIVVQDAFDITLTPENKAFQMTPGYLKANAQVKVDSEEKAATLSSAHQIEVIPSTGKFLEKVTIPAAVATPAGGITATADNVLAGTTAVVASGDVSDPYKILEGTIVNKGLLQLTLKQDETTTPVDAGYYTGGQIIVEMDKLILDPDKNISTEVFKKTDTDDYDLRINVNIPKGTYNAQTASVVMESFFPDPTHGSQAAASEILVGSAAYDKTGKEIVGTMPKQTTNVPINPLTQETVPIPLGYFDGTTNVVLTPDLENALDELIGE